MITSIGSGAVGDGIADDTVPLRNFLSSLGNGGEGRLCAGTYRITGPLSLNASNVQLIGENKSIILVDGNFDALTLGNGSSPCRNLRMSDIEIFSAVRRTAGSMLTINYVQNCFFDRCRFTNPFIGINIIRGYQAYVSDCWITCPTPVNGIGVIINGQGNDQYIRDTRIVGSQPEQPYAGIDVRNTGGAWFTNVGTIYAGTGFKIVPTQNKVVEFLFMSGCSADLGTGHGYLIGGGGGVSRSIYSTQDWSSSNALNGVMVAYGTDIRFEGMRCYNNIKHGMQLTSGSDFLVSGCTFSGNGGFQVPSYHGLVIGGVDGARIIGNRSGQVPGFAALQGSGIFVASPAANNLLISDNDCRANITSAMALTGNYKLGVNVP